MSESTQVLDTNVSAKDEEIERIKKDADDKIAKIAADAQKKVSEHSEELGSLRKFKQEIEPKIAALEAELSGNKNKEKQLEDNPKLVLEAMKPTLDELVAAGKLLNQKLSPEMVKQIYADPKQKVKALADALDVVRDESVVKPDFEAFAMEIAKSKNNISIDPSDIKKILRDGLKIDEKKSLAAPHRPSVVSVYRSPEEDVSSAQKYVDLKTSYLKPKQG